MSNLKVTPPYVMVALPFTFRSFSMRRLKGRPPSLIPESPVTIEPEEKEGGIFFSSGFPIAPLPPLPYRPVISSLSISRACGKRESNSGIGRIGKFPSEHPARRRGDIGPHQAAFFLKHLCTTFSSLFSLSPPSVRCHMLDQLFMSSVARREDGRPLQDVLHRVCCGVWSHTHTHCTLVRDVVRRPHQASRRRRRRKRKRKGQKDMTTKQQHQRQSWRTDEKREASKKPSFTPAQRENSLSHLVY